MSVDLSGEITAIATALLAIFAILTTIYAVRAFRKQSQEVTDQASMLQVQSEQLAEQRKINAEQTKVLALQASELGESLRSANAKRNSEGVNRPRGYSSRRPQDSTSSRSGARPACRTSTTIYCQKLSTTMHRTTSPPMKTSPPMSQNGSSLG
jgi:hypothetical protein